MNYSIRIWVPVLLLSCLNWACSSGGSDSGSAATGVDPQGNPPAATDPISTNTEILIRGFWDISSTDEMDQANVAYVEVSPDGVVTDYEYDQNTSGGGLNCFNVEISQLTALGNNRYEQTDPIDGGVDLFTAIKDGELLTVSYIDVNDENQNGDRTELLTDAYPAAVGIAAVDLTLCDEDNSQSQGEAIIGADGIIGHPPAEMIGTWTYQSVTVNQQPADLASYIGFADGAVDARLHILTNSAYFYEEVDSRGGQLWAEWGFIYFNDGEFDVNQQFDTAGPAGKMTVLNYFLLNGSLILSETINGELVVFVLTM